MISSLNAEEFDAVVIGSGAGGAAAAWRLTEKGWRVLILEAGPPFDPARDYLLHTPAWETQMFPEKPGSQGRYTFSDLETLKDEWRDLRSWNAVSGLINQTSSRQAAGTGYQHVRGVGGATLHFTGEAHRLHPDAMQMRSRFGVAADWPLTYAELDPYYVLLENLIGVAGPAETGVRWRSHPYPLPAHRLSKASRRLQQAAATLGMNWQANARAALSKPYDGRPDCNYCGNCNRGCPRRDKGSADVTLIPRALATGRCVLAPNTIATSIQAGLGGHVSHVHYVGPAGKRGSLTVKRLILACGAVETPRLLLASTSELAPQGLANESGQVGRNFMETLSWVSTGLLDEQVESHKGLPSDAIGWDFNGPKAIPGVIGGCRFYAAVQEGGLNGPVSYARQIVAGWGHKHKAALRASLGHAVSVGAIGEFLPNPKTFIDLDDSMRDAYGIPLARIHSRLAAMDIQRLRFMASTCRSILQAAGVKALVAEHGTLDFFNATHVMGTCRMGNDPKQSVTNANGRCHAWRNLYICDASLFPSSGGGESPSLTIQALAVRIADAMLRTQERFLW